MSEDLTRTVTVDELIDENAKMRDILAAFQRAHDCEDDSQYPDYINSANAMLVNFLAG